MQSSNASLGKLINTVMTNLLPGQFTVKLTLMSEDGSWVWPDKGMDNTLLQSMVLHQDFANHYTDDLIVTSRIASADYHQMYLNRQGLKAILRMDYLGPNGIPQKVLPPKVMTYTATLIDPKDISRSLTDVKYRVLPDMDMSVKLFEDEAYRVRHEGVNVIYQKSKIGDVIGHLANSFGLNNVHITPVDNQHVWEHIVLPGFQSFATVFDYLQHHYGVYSQGISSYYTNGYLWIWPLFDTNPIFPSQVKIYQSQEGAYAGSYSFYTKEDDSSIAIVTNHRSGIMDRSINESENSGTAVMFTRASPEIDGIVSQNSGVLTYNQDTSIVIRKSNPNLTHKDRHFTRYAHQTDNIHALTSHLAQGQHIETVVTWDMAVPYQIMPGQLVTYYSDHDGKTVSRTGQVTNAVYNATRTTGTGRISGKVAFQCQAYLTLRLSPDEEIVSS